MTPQSNLINRTISFFARTRWIALIFCFFLSTEVSFGQLSEEHLLSITPLNGAFDVELSDIDMDGDLDVIFILLNDDKLCWFENLGSGNFSTVQDISNGGLSSPQSFEIGDLNNDGFPDIVVNSLSNTVSWYASLGNGMFSSQNLIPFTATSNVSRSTIGDFDNDGDQDLILYSFGTNLLNFSENLGAGNFAPEVLIANNVPGYTRALTAADFDNDGLLDFAFAAEDDLTIGWLKNLTGTTFGPIQITTSIPYDPTDLKSVDLDNDGDMDLVFASPGLGGLAWLENDGNGAFSPEAIIGNTVAPRTFDIGHINDDGYLDFFTSSGATLGPAAVWFENLQNGTWNTPFGAGNNTNSPRGISVGDMDNDGDQDAVVITLNSARWFENYFIAPNILKGTIFHDENANGVFDSNEHGMRAGSAIITPGGNSSYANDLGEYAFSETPGTFSIEHQGLLPSPLWTLTTDTVLTATTVLNAPPIENLNFGYSIASTQRIVAASITGSQPVCDHDNVYWLNVTNQGTTKPSGIIRVDLDDSTSFVDASVTPDSIVGSSIYWHYDTINYFDQEVITFHLDMPSYLSFGDTLLTTLQLIETDSVGNVTDSLWYGYQEILLCAYDPNDKRSTPAGIGSQGIIPLVDDLEYMIRFQNTGNFPATNVMITDTLDANLDWSSLQYLSASHPVEISRDATGIVKFKFNNIYLPDSTSNEPESHGFVKFKIDLVPGLMPDDVIQNQANIYFDFNPPIITNQVTNTIETLPGTPTGEETELFLFPNPSDGKFDVLILNNTSVYNTIVIADLAGKVTYKQSNLSGPTVPIDLSDIRSGLYIVYLYDQSGRVLTSEKLVKN